MTQHRLFYLAIIFLIGFTSLVYEVYSVKVLFLFFTESTQAVTLALSAFLAGLAFSSLLFSALSRKDRSNSHRLIFWMQVAVALYGYFILQRYDLIPEVIDTLNDNIESPGIFSFLKATLIWIYLFIPAFFIGGAFPLINGLYLQHAEHGTRDTGMVYFWDTLGSIIGVFCAGFWWLPEFGFRMTAITTVAINLTVVIMLAGNWRIRSSLILLLLLMATWETMHAPNHDKGEQHGTRVGAITDELRGDAEQSLPPVGPDYPALSERFGRALFQKMSPFGRVTVGTDVLGIPGNKGLFINYRDMCLSIDHGSESLLGTLAARGLRENARVLNIGLGCGFTANSVASQDNVAHVDIVEINPVVAEATASFFVIENNHVLSSPKVRMAIQDGAEYMRTTNSRYDAVIIDIEEVSVIYSSPLYTQEYFEIIRKKLAPGGRLALWAQTGSLEFEKVIYNTLKSVFPHVSVRVIDETFYTFYASDQALDIRAQDATESRIIERMLDTPLESINTLDNKALEKYFNIRSFFDLPYDYRERFINE